MISFRQDADSFFVKEEPLYPPSGQGAYRWVRIRKRNKTTKEAERKCSEQTGVPWRHIRHAGMKDRLATAEQWLSWPKDMERMPPGDSEDIQILETSRHENSLMVGHVARNHFRLILHADQPLPVLPQLAQPFPNYYGRQRFGAHRLGQDVLEHWAKTTKQREDISCLQARLFNRWLHHRLSQNMGQPGENELWTSSNGKRCFRAELDDELSRRYGASEVVHTGPIYGYKMQLTPPELAYLAELGEAPESFRKWGKQARGARRPLFVTPGDVSVSPLGEEQQALSFSLPSGSYATVYLTHLFRKDDLNQPEETWPDFTQQVTLA